MKLLTILTLVNLVSLINFHHLTPLEPDYHIELPEVTITAPHTLESKWCLFRDLGSSLPITISPERFADACMVVYWCESRVSPDAVSKDGHDSQGFFQPTAKTRRRLGIPKKICHMTFEQQIPFLKLYLLKSKKLHLVKNTLDLHELNFAPGNMGKRRLSGYIKGLDRDHDGIITRHDLYLFEKDRIKKEPFLIKCFNNETNKV